MGRDLNKGEKQANDPDRRRPDDQQGYSEKILSVEYNVLEAENGAAALDILTVQNKKVNAILLDLVMPVMDGYEFLVRIRNTEFEDLPVIVLTGETGKRSGTAGS